MKKEVQNKLPRTLNNLKNTAPVFYFQIISTLVFCLFCLPVFSQTGVLKGKILGDGEPMPMAVCRIEKLEIQRLTDAAGHFILEKLPIGTHTFSVSYVGFLPEFREISISKNDTAHLEIELRENPFRLNQIVVSGTRTARRRLDSPVAVNVLSSATMAATQSNTLAEGICFQPGLRLETDCQTCNYTQLRMNGLGGKYSQILVDSRPIFNALMSLYGLEQMPASQIERVEVVRGGGSVLFGANAIAGTVNIITREPQENDWSVGQNFAQIGGRAADHFTNINASLTGSEKKTAASFFASRRTRDGWDANGDGFTEMPELANTSFGGKIFLKPAAQHKISINAWHIHEFRRGGNAPDLPADRADQSEERTHDIAIGGADYTFSPTAKKWRLQVFSAFQKTRRRHYTGIDHSDGWGNTRSLTNISGAQWNLDFSLKNIQNSLILGIEHQFDDTFDEIKGYNFLIDQKTHLTGFFAQTEWKFSPKLTALAGVRLNKHNFLPNPIATPRANILFKPSEKWQFRSAWARGFTAPQAFEADMHIAFAGGGVSFIRLDPNLIPETSNSVNFSADFNDPRPTYIYGFTTEIFRTRLFDAFVLEETGADAAGNQQLLRRNGGHSTVAGLTLEARFNYNQKVQLETGFTLQTSRFDRPVAWSQEVGGIQKYLRTPEKYGFFTLIFFPEKKLNGTLSGIYTGKMLVPHFAGAPGILKDELFDAPSFFELNFKISQKFRLPGLENGLTFSAGVQNVFNSFQSNFDSGKFRDSNFVYGSSRPRTVFVGVILGKN